MVCRGQCARVSELSILLQFRLPFSEAWDGKNSQVIWTSNVDQKQMTNPQYLPLAEKVNPIPGLVLWPDRD